MIDNRPNYRAREISHDDYPVAGSETDQIRHIISYGLMAPSTHNTQPWRIGFAGGRTVVLRPDWSRALPHSDLQGRNIFISLGCCLQNILVAGAHYGWSARYALEGAGESAKITIGFERGPRATANDEQLFSAIATRSTHKLAFKDTALPKAFVDSLTGLGHAGANLTVATDPGIIEYLAGLHRTAVMDYVKNARFTREVGAWMRPTGTRRYDGMPGHTFGLNRPASIAVKGLTLLTPASVKVVAKKDFAVLRACPALGMITSAADNPADWVESGRLYVRAALFAAAHGISFAPKSAGIEMGYGPQMLQPFGAAGAAQIYFGIGYGDGVARYTPRRPLEHVLTSEVS